MVEIFHINLKNKIIFILFKISVPSVPDKFQLKYLLVESTTNRNRNPLPNNIYDDFPNSVVEGTTIKFQINFKHYD